MSPVIPVGGLFDTEPFSADLYDSFSWSETLPDGNADITVDVLDASDNSVLLSDLTDETGEDLTDSSLTGKLIRLRFKLQMVASTPVLSDYTLTTASNVPRVGSFLCILYTKGGGTATWTNTTSFGDLSAYTGVSSGAPTQGTIGLWMYIQDASNISAAISLSIGSAVIDSVSMSGVEYASSGTYGLEDATWVDGWNYALFKLHDPAAVNGTPDWTAVDFVRLDIPTTAETTIYIDYFTISKSLFIGLNGLGDRRGDEVTEFTQTW